METYKFNSWDGEDVRKDEITGDIQATIIFGGLEFEVYYTLEKDWSAFKASIAGQYADLTGLKDAYGMNLFQAITEAQTKLYDHLLSKQEDCGLDDDVRSEEWA